MTDHAEVDMIVIMSNLRVAFGHVDVDVITIMSTSTWLLSRDLMLVSTANLRVDFNVRNCQLCGVARKAGHETVCVYITTCGTSGSAWCMCCSYLLLLWNVVYLPIYGKMSLAVSMAKQMSDGKELMSTSLRLVDIIFLWLTIQYVYLLTIWHLYVNTKDR